MPTFENADRKGRGCQSMAKKKRALSQVDRMTNIVEQMQEHYLEAWDFVLSAAENSQPFRDVLRSKQFTGLLRYLDIETKEESEEGPPVLTALAVVNKQGEFILYPGSYTSGWFSQEYSGALDGVLETRNTLPADMGIIWYGRSLFQHRPVNCFGKITPTDNPYREITVSEFFLKSLTCDLFHAMHELKAGLGEAVKSLRESYAASLRGHWDVFRIPGSLLDNVEKDFSLFCRLEKESILHQSGRMIKEGTALPGSLDQLFTHYKTVFPWISRLDSRHFLNGKPVREALDYRKDLLQLTVGAARGTEWQHVLPLVQLNPDNWLDWVIQTALMNLVIICARLNHGDTEMFADILEKQDVRSGPLWEALHLQNLRITPISTITCLTSLVFSQYRYTELRELENSLLKKYKEIRGTFTTITNDLKDIFSMCARGILEGEETKKLQKKIDHQQKIIVGDTIERFTHVDPSIFKEGDLFAEESDLMGRGALMHEVYEKIRKYAQIDRTVLITGRSGTGKELVAHAIQKLGQWKKKPYVKINCGAITETLLESELFGHEKGAFTNAHRRHIGRFELADSGTLFMDEVGDLSYQAQIKLLRVLQDGTFMRVGGEKEIKVDVRVLCATNRHLRELIRERKFREDLYARIKVLSIDLPCLKDRPEDIPLLAVRFILKGQKEFPGVNITEITREAHQGLLAYSWPLNVRELENFIYFLLANYFMGTGKHVVVHEDIEKAMVTWVKDKEWAVELQNAEHQKDDRVTAVSSSDEADSSNSLDPKSEAIRLLELFRKGGISWGDHKEIYESYGKWNGMEIYLELFELGKAWKGTYRNFYRALGLYHQAGRIQLQRHTFAEKLKEADPRD